MEKVLEQGVVEPSHGPWSSPVVLVEKKDGSKWFCVDYCRLNSYDVLVIGRTFQEHLGNL